MIQELLRLLAQAWSRRIGVRKPPTEIKQAGLAARIVRAMHARDYAVDRGEGEINIVYIEGANADGTPNDNAPNRFNDRRIVIGIEGGVPTVIGNWQATSEPGRRYTHRPLPGVDGAARIKVGQHRAWQVGIHHAGKPSGHEALVQTGGPVTVCRDVNKDHQRARDRETTGWYGINQHWGYDFPEDDIRTASAGCLVGRTREGHRAFMAIVKSDPRYRTNRNFVFATTVMPAQWVQ
jgi:hypothetical protein